jgi:formylglycine-generating enzyme required for sulfatase activity
MSTKEVSNKEYLVFLNDLVIHNKIDDYLKAVPDTTKWNIFKLRNNTSLVNLYLWHPAYKDYPVVNVSREGAEMYCRWLTIEANEKIKKDNPVHSESFFINDVRIPHETEWMMAARGGVAGAEYPWGTTRVQNDKGCFLTNFGFYKSMDKIDTVNNSCSLNRNATTSAGSVMDESMLAAPTNAYNPNPYGLYCMSGNVAEMVWKKQTKFGTKGGSWNSDCEHVKISAVDEYEGIIDASPFIGFRPVFTAKK